MNTEPQPITPPAVTTNPGGRPTKRTPARLARILALAKEGHSIRYICGVCNVSEDALANWRKDPASDFSAKFDAALAQSEAALIETIRSASKEDWRAAAWLAERRFAESWSNKAKLVHAIEQTEAAPSWLREMQEERQRRDRGLSGEGSVVVDVEVLTADRMHNT